MSLTAEAIFDAFLRRIHKKNFEIPPKRLHRLFYRAFLRHPDQMTPFHFLLRTEPYSPTLARLVWEFQQANQLGRMNPDYKGYVMKPQGDALPVENQDEADLVVNTLIELVGLETVSETK